MTKKILLTKENVLERGRRYATRSLGYREECEQNIDEISRAYLAGYNLGLQAEEHLSGILITPRTNSVSVVCVETGEVFSSMTELATKLGRSNSFISYKVRFGDKIDGKTYKKENDEKYKHNEATVHKPKHVPFR